MIRLSLPAFDARRPLRLTAYCSQQGFNEFQTYSIPFHFRTWVDGFVGNVQFSFAEVPVPMAPSSQRVFFVSECYIGNPDHYGLTGSEGWFDLVPIQHYWTWVHDLQITYTEAEQQTDGRADGHYS